MCENDKTQTLERKRSLCLQSSVGRSEVRVDCNALVKKDLSVGERLMTERLHLVAGPVNHFVQLMQLVNVSFFPSWTGQNTDTGLMIDWVHITVSSWVWCVAELKLNHQICCAAGDLEEKKKTSELLHPRHIDVTLHWCARGSMSVWNCCSVQKRRPNVKVEQESRLYTSTSLDGGNTHEPKEKFPPKLPAKHDFYIGERPPWQEDDVEQLLTQVLVRKMWLASRQMVTQRENMCKKSSTCCSLLVCIIGCLSSIWVVGTCWHTSSISDTSLETSGLKKKPLHHMSNL